MKPNKNTDASERPLDLSIMRGRARENDAHDEAKAEACCGMGVGCGMAGACYAEKMGRPEMCARVAHNMTMKKQEE